MRVYLAPSQPQYYILRKTYREDNPDHKMPNDVMKETVETSDGQVVEEVYVKREKT